MDIGYCDVCGQKKQIEIEGEMWGNICVDCCKGKKDDKK